MKKLLQSACLSRPPGRSCKPLKTNKAGILAACFVVCSSAVAQTSPSVPVPLAEPESKALSPVTVTGVRKRIDNLQETPQSATVLSREQIKDARIRSIEQLQAFVPNFRVSSSGGRGGKGSIAIRGFFNTDFSKDPSVGLYIDDMPFSDLSTYSSILFDMKSIEVLRGPQSTLYGVNTPAGVINITTLEPAKIFSAEAESELGNYNSRLVRARVSGPLGSPDLTASLAVAKENSDGFIKNVFNNTPYNKQDTQAIRAKLRWQPNASWDINLMAQQRDIADTGAPYHYLPLSGADYAAKVPGAPLLKNNQVWVNSLGAVGQKEGSVALKVAFSGEQFQFTSITSSRTQKNFFSEYDIDDSAGPVDAGALFGAPPGVLVAPGLAGSFGGSYKQQSQEFRLQSPAAGPESFVWLTGLYFGREQEDGIGLFGVLPGPASPFVDLRYNNRSSAVFGQATRRFLDNALGLTAGARYESVNRQGANPLANLDQTTKSNQWLPRLGADYRINPDMMVYADLARGWKPAGVVPEAPAGLPFAYKPEITTSAEVGIKTEWLNNQVSVNVAAFQATAKGYQDTVRVTPLIRYLTNVDEVRSRGLEFEAQWRPIRNLELGATLGYVDARYLRYQNPDGTNFNGNRVVLTPNQSIGLSASWKAANGIYLRGDLTRFGDYFYDRDNKQRQAGYTMVNAKLGYKQKNWEVYLYGENLTNARYFERSFPGTVYSNVAFGPPEKPRRLGLGAVLNF